MNIHKVSKKRKGITIMCLLLILAIAGFCIWKFWNRKEEGAVTSDSSVQKLSDITYDSASTYKDSGSYAKGTITADGVALDGTSFEILEIARSVGEGKIYLDNLTISDYLLVYGGGEDSVYLDVSSDGKKKKEDEDNPGSNVARIQMQKPNTHLVIGNSEIEELVVYGTNLVEIYGNVGKITVVGSLPKDHQYDSGIFVAEGAVVGEIELQEQTAVYGAPGSIGKVTSLAEGIDTSVRPLPVENVSVGEEEDSDASDDRGNYRGQQRPTGGTSGGSSQISGGTSPSEDPSQPDIPSEDNDSDEM